MVRSDHGDQPPPDAGEEYKRHRKEVLSRQETWKENEMPDERRLLERLEMTNVTQFTWGFHHRFILIESAAACPLSLHERRERCGYKNTNKFIKREGDWLGCLRPIPLVYLETIGCDLETLRKAVVLDGEEYEKALPLLPPPRCFAIRLGCGMVSFRDLPDNCSVEQAQALIQQFQAEQPRLGCCLDWSGMRTLFFEKGELVREVLYPPQFIVTREGVSFGGGIGVSMTSFQKGNS